MKKGHIEATCFKKQKGLPRVPKPKKEDGETGGKKTSANSVTFAPNPVTSTAPAPSAAPLGVTFDDDDEDMRGIHLFSMGGLDVDESSVAERKN